MKSIERIVEEALDLAPGTVKEHDDRETLDGWDSLGHIKLLTHLDEELEGRAAEIQELAEAMSVRAIKQILTARGLVR